MVQASHDLVIIDCRYLVAYGAAVVVEKQRSTVPAIEI